MKVFFTILAIYIVALQVMPCADTFEKDASHLGQAVDGTAHDHRGEHAEATDFCSPFCVCNCCGVVPGIILQWNIYVSYKMKSPVLSKPEAVYTSVFIPGYFGEIWQPPRINA